MTLIGDPDAKSTIIGIITDSSQFNKDSEVDDKNQGKTL